MDLTIAVIGPLDSPEALVARSMLTAVRATVHAAGPVFGGRVAVRELDDGRDPELAVRLVERCIDDPDVIGVVGPKNSGSALATRELACSAGLPLLLPAATADALSGPGTSLRMCAPDAATAAAAAQLASGLRARSLWVESDDSAYGQRLAIAVRSAAARRQIPLAIAVEGADAAFLAMGEVELAARLKALRTHGYPGAVIGAEGGPGASLAVLAGDVAEGTWQLYPGTHAPGHRHVYSAEAAAAATALLRAFDATGDRTEIATWLHRRDREVVGSELGPLWFDPDGERVGASVGLWRIEDGRSVPVNIQPAAIAAL